MCSISFDHLTSWTLAKAKAFVLDIHLLLYLETDYMCCLQQFLYPSEEDLYKLIRFLVERLPEVSDGKSKVLEDGDGRKETKADTLKCHYVSGQSDDIDTDDSVFTHQKVENKLSDLNIIVEETKSSDSSVGRFSDSGEAAMFDNLVNAPKDQSEVSGNESVAVQGNNGQVSISRHEVSSYIQKNDEVSSSYGF